MLRESITKNVIEAIERGWVPDAVTRALSRRLCASRLRALGKTNGNGEPFAVDSFADQMRIGPIAPLPDKANEQHYELPSEFFELMLGQRLKYSCCYFDDQHATIDDAEIAALRQTCHRAELTDAMEVLELGCGWGSLSLWMLEHYPAIRVTAVSNSRPQRQLIMRRAESLGVANRLTVITADMNEFSIDKTYDRIVSCEMFEHMRNYEHLLRRVAGWLKPGGKLFVHIFCHKTFAYEFQADGASNWMGRYFFSGGIMPSRNLFGQFDSDIRVTKQWNWVGTHYQRTCNAWLERLDQRKSAAMDMLRLAYDDQQAERWFQRWRLFLIAGAELFGYDRGRQWIIGHYLLEPVAIAKPLSRQGHVEVMA